VNHVAIDLGSRESQICVRGPDGVILEEKRYPTRKLTEYVATLGPSRVILETSSEAFRVADAAKAAGHEVRVVPATMVKLLGVTLSCAIRARIVDCDSTTPSFPPSPPIEASQQTVRKPTCTEPVRA
jgi:hypothetical protein